MISTWIDRLTETSDDKRLFQQEKTILEVTELICALMKEQNVSRKILAERLYKTKGYVSQLLDGEANMTLRTLSDVLYALGKELQASTVPMLRNQWNHEWSKSEIELPGGEITICNIAPEVQWHNRSSNDLSLTSQQRLAS